MANELVSRDEVEVSRDESREITDVATKNSKSNLDDMTDGGYMEWLGIEQNGKNVGMIKKGGELYVSGEEGLQVAIVAHKYMCKRYDETYSDNPNREPVCWSSNELTPDKGVREPLCGDQGGPTPCKKIWDNLNKRFVKRCPYFDHEEFPCISFISVALIDLTCSEIDDDFCIGDPSMPSSDLLRIEVKGVSWPSWSILKKKMKKTLKAIQQIRKLQGKKSAVEALATFRLKTIERECKNGSTIKIGWDFTDVASTAKKLSSDYSKVSEYMKSCDDEFEEFSVTPSAVEEVMIGVTEDFFADPEMDLLAFRPLDNEDE